MVDLLCAFPSRWNTGEKSVPSNVLRTGLLGPWFASLSLSPTESGEREESQIRQLLFNQPDNYYFGRISSLCAHHIADVNWKVPHLSYICMYITQISVISLSTEMIQTVPHRLYSSARFLPLLNILGTWFHLFCLKILLILFYIFLTNGNTGARLVVVVVVVVTLIIT